MTWRMLDALSAPAGRETVHQIGWVLVHSLWQGLVVAAALAGALHGLRNRSAAARYAASCAAMLLVAALPLVTFAVVGSFQRPTAEGHRLAAEPTVVIGAGVDPQMALVALPAATISAPHIEPSTFPARWGHWIAGSLPTLFPWLVGAWAAGVGALSVWHVGGWLRVRRLRRSGTRSLGPGWDEAVARLCRRMRVAAPVRLFESALVQVPAVVGWLRPVILVPASALTGLSPRQLEAILAHELAHVRRHDYLVNLLQSVVETLLFYHPAVWWISGRVRLEREDCCDDVASRVCGGATLYARALAAMEELRNRQDVPGGASAATPGFALGADGGARRGGGQLLRRIRRLFGKPEPDRRTRLAAWPAALVAAACPLLPLAAVAVGRVSSDDPAPSAVTVAPSNEPTAAAPAQPTDERVPGDSSVADDAHVSVKRVELTRLIDERIKITRDLAEARGKLANLKTLNDAGDDPPGLEEALAQDDNRLKYRKAIKQLETDLETKPFGAQHPQTLRARGRIESLRQKLNDVREEIRNDLFTSRAAQHRADITAGEQMLKDVSDRITRAEGEFARADAEWRDRAAAAAPAKAPPAAPLAVEDIARIDPTMLERARERDRLRRDLERLRLTMQPDNPAVVRTEGELKLEERRIDERAKDFRAKRVVTTSPATEPAARSGAAAPAPAGNAVAGNAPAAAPGGVYYVGGRIARPGAYTLGNRPVNLLQALIAAGLDVDSERDRQVVLLRREDAGKGDAAGADAPPREVATTLTVGELVDHRDKDRFLRADDIVLLRAAPAPPAAGQGVTMIDPPPGLWARMVNHLTTTGHKDVAGFTVVSAYADDAAGEAFVALRLPGEGRGGEQAIVVRLHRDRDEWKAESAMRGVPLGGAGAALGRFQEEFPNARRFAEPLSVPPLKAKSGGDATN